MALQLYLDEDVDPLLARVLRERGVDCLSTQEANNCGKSDTEQLIFASNHNRAILTFNVKDFAELSQVYAGRGEVHAGIILSQHLPFREVLRRMLILLQNHRKEGVQNRILWLQDFQTPSTQ